MGHLGFIYIDGGYSALPDKPSAQVASALQSKEIRASGLVINDEKSNWDPAQIGEWLGLIVNTISITSVLPKKKVAEFKNILQSVL